MSKFFGRSRSTNDVFVEQQQREAEDAERRAAELKARREQAVADINATYSTIGDDFYDGYRQSFLDYYTPQLEEQFSDARSQTLFDHVRKGTTRSSAYAERMADLFRDKSVNEAQIYNDADRRTAELRDRVASEKQGALELASYAEDPSMAATRALTEVNAVQNVSPNISPLGDIFQTAAMAYRSYQDAKDRQSIRSGLQTTNPYKSAGRNIG